MKLLLNLGLGCALAITCGCTKKLEEENARISGILAQSRSDLAAAQAKIAGLEEQVRKLTPPPQFEVSGEIFIATKGGTSYKLGAVEVLIYPRSVVEETIKKTTSAQLTAMDKIRPLMEAAELEKTEAQREWSTALKALAAATETDAMTAAAKRRWETEQKYEQKQKVYEQYLALADAALSSANYFQTLPEPKLRTRTNSEGHYQLKIDREGDYVIAARSERTVGANVEHYYWMLPIAKPEGEQAELILSNDNLSSVPSRGSLIPSRAE